MTARRFRRFNTRDAFVVIAWVAIAGALIAVTIGAISALGCFAVAGSAAAFGIAAIDAVDRPRGPTR